MDTTAANRRDGIRGAEAPRVRALPFEPLDLLAGRSRRLANLVESISRRRDVRDLRARLLALLLELRCPPGVRPRKAWYVPGAVARLGIEGLRRAWAGFFGEVAPCPRTLRAHLGVLERCLAIVRQPGDWIDGPDPAAGWRPRWPDTLHVLEDEGGAAWWHAEGRELLRRHPEARTSPDAWRRRIGSWRARRRPEARQGELFEGLAGSLRASSPRPFAEGLPDRLRPAASVPALREALAAAADAPGVLAALRAAGAEVRGRPLLELAGAPQRLLGAAGMLLRALERGDAVRSRAAWLVRAFRLASSAELEGARAEFPRRALGGGVGFELRGSPP